MRNGLSHSDAGKLGGQASLEVITKLKQKRIDIYNLNAKKCKYCNEPILYEKRHNNIFCNHHCAALFNNPLIIHSLENPINKFCILCNSALKNGTKFCSRKCQKSNNWINTKENLIKNGYDKSYGHHIAKKYLLELTIGKCQICELDTWNNQPMPLVLDHINGNSEDGSLINLRVICNNCDALTDTYKSKNIGNGRSKRRKRYQDGKSY